MSGRKRMLKELKEFAKESDVNSSLKLLTPPEVIDDVQIAISIENNNLYDSSTFYCLSYKIGADYPFSPPQIMFIGDHIPLHPHIYSNGHICLNILYDGWTPVQSILSIALSLQSMLINNTTAERPPDDESHCRYGSSNPLASKWIFHDDNV